MKNKAQKLRDIVANARWFTPVRSFKFDLLDAANEIESQERQILAIMRYVEALQLKLAELRIKVTK